MSNLRTKAQEIQAAGVAERGNFTPSGVPSRLYQYWLKHTRSKSGRAIRDGDRRENFCHFWRVVLIWAPLRGLVRGLDKALPVITVLAVVVFVATAIYLLMTEGNLLIALAVVLGLVVAALAIVLVGMGLEALHSKYWRSEWNEPLAKVLVGLMALILAGLVTLGLVSWALATSFYLVGGILVAAAFGGLFLFLAGSRLADHLAGQRALAKAEHEARREAFINGELSRKEYYGAPRTPNAFERRVAAFLSGVADFIILIAQVVRVKKWKICPLVEVDTQ